MMPSSTAFPTVVVIMPTPVLGTRSMVSFSMSLNLGQSLSSGSTKSSTSIMLNSLMRIMPCLGAISLRYPLPVWMTPMGIFSLL